MTARSLVLATSTLALALAFVSGCSGCSKAPPVPLETDTSGPLVFPPPAEAWLDRAPLPSAPPARLAPSDPQGAEEEGAIRVRSPELSADGTFEPETSLTIELAFTEPLFETTAESAKAPRVTITPAAPVRTVWTSPETLEVRAESPLDPGTDYTLTLPGFRAPNGHELRPWKARFRPKPESVVAGKTVPFVAVPGVVRPVYVRPIEDSVVGPSRELVVLFDQPVALDVAQKLVSAKDDQDRPVPLTLTHPPPGKTFEGQKIDTQAVVLARFGRALPPRTKVGLKVTSQKDTQPPIERVLTIASLPTLGELGCVNVEKCDVQGMRVKASPHAGITLPVSNWVRDSAVKGHVTVTPTPKNLVTYGGGEYITVDAAWDAATTYQIRIAGVVDRYGYRVPDASITFEALPRSYSAVLREGVFVLDDVGVKDFYVTTRNVKRGELRFWPVGADTASIEKALGLSAVNDPPTGAPPVTVPFSGIDVPHQYARTPIDLTGKLEPGKMYLASVEAKDGAYGAKPVEWPSWSPAAKPSVPLVVFAGKDSLGAHAHIAGRTALVQVYRLGSGDAVTGAEVDIGGAKATTDAKGTARLDLPAALKFPSETDTPLGVVVRSGAEATVVPLTEKVLTSAHTLYPELTREDAGAASKLLGFLVTDRGVYQPGAKLHVKAFLRRNDGGRVVAVKGEKVRLRIEEGYTNETLLDEALVTSASGVVAKDVELPSTVRSGPARVKLVLDDEAKTEVASEEVRVASFERPRFLVDLEDAAIAGDAVTARVAARYGFGTPMDGGRLSWSVSRRPATIEGGPFVAQGYAFGKERSWRDEWSTPPTARGATGEGKLDAKGAYALRAALGPSKTEGPEELTLEADVSDASYRHVAAKKTLVRHAGARYSGLRLGTSFGAPGTLKVEAVAVDTTGKPLGDVPVEIRLEKLAWKRAGARAESGATIEAWTSDKTTLGTCSVTTDAAAGRACELRTEKGGEYRITTFLDGREDASLSYWVWSEGDESSEATPAPGSKLQVKTDRKRYKPGDTAQVLAASPYPEATAILAVENGGIVAHQVKQVKGGVVVFDVPVTIAHAPQAWAAVTLLPRHSSEASYRVGAVKLPVALDDAALTVDVRSSKKTYDAKEKAEITVEVKRGGKPAKGVDLTLAVVDEGVLRLTNHHAKDPMPALHPARGLAFLSADSRALFFRRREKAHPPGGGGAEDGPVETRKDFADTAAWKPDLVTGEDGKASFSFTLPDNLTEWRMMAVAVDESGAAGSAERGFVVTRPYLLEPVLPRFALRGDEMEIAAMVHNNTPQPVVAKVKIGDELREVPLAAMGKARVATRWKAEASRDVTMTLEIDGAVKDKVERRIAVSLPGTEEHPQLAGVFRDVQEVTVEIPEDASFEAGAKLVVKAGSALYPELGHRVAYLTEYPHGCVEQTTSSTLPLLAAKNILAWTGAAGLSDEELRKRIAFGVKRLASMKTSSGGLAYWPGGSDTHELGTAYAARALLRASEMGIAEPELLPGVLRYLEGRLPQAKSALLKVSIAEVLAQAEKLPESSADALWDVRDELDAYGTASLALALSSLPSQRQRVSELVDRLEVSFDKDGLPTKEHGQRDWHDWGSADRDRAQTLIALVKLRPKSRLAPALAMRLSKHVDGYTTQSTAWSLVAMSDYVGTAKPNGKVDVKVRAEGRILDTFRTLGGNNKEVVVPLAELRGKKVLFRLEGEKDTPSSFAMEARYARPDDRGGKVGKRQKLGPTIHRVYTDPKGGPVDLAKLAPGDVVRVALRAEVTPPEKWRGVYLAVTDRFAAGFEPIQPDLATVASVAEMTPAHPFYTRMGGGGGSVSHIDVRDDRVNVYYDHAYGEVYATYLLRVVTPGSFTMPAAHGELMYEPGSEGYSDAATVVVK